MQKATIKFKSIDIRADKNYAILNAENGEKYSFFLTKKDGTESKARIALKEINPQEGQPLNILYEINGQYKNLGMVYRAGENDIPMVSPPTSTSESLLNRIEELEKRVSGIETHILGDPSKKDSLDLHQSFDDIPVIDNDLYLGH